MRRELLLDDFRGIARARHEPLDAFVVGALAEELKEGGPARGAVTFGDVQQRHRAAVRARELDPETRGELRVAAAADGDEDAPRAGRHALRDSDVAGRVSKDLLDGRAEQVPARPSPPNHEQVRPLVRARFADRVPAEARDRHERADGVPRARLRHERVERAAAAPRFRLRRREPLVTGHLDDRGRDDLAAVGERERGLEERTVTLGVGNRDEDLHLRDASEHERDHALGQHPRPGKRARP